jgi:hypothetical protein
MVTKITEFRAALFQSLDQSAESYEPIQITGKRTNAVRLPVMICRFSCEKSFLL